MADCPEQCPFQSAGSHDLGGQRPISVSVVSHGHGTMVLALLKALSGDPQRLQRVWITLDVPEAWLHRAIRSRGWPFEVRVLVNPRSQSFARNHNTAFEQEWHLRRASPSHWLWWVLNPDISWAHSPCTAVRLGPSAPAVQYPAQVSPRGEVLDYERPLPTPWRMLERVIRQGSHGAVHVAPSQAPFDWVNAACLFVRADVYRQLKGFDERYRLYVEDVDFCLRLQLAGHTLHRIDASTVTHDAARQSRRRIRHMVWHMAGLLRLWSSPVYWQYWRRCLR